MERGQLYRVEKPSKRDPKRHRIYAIVSRNFLIEVNFPTLICVPVFSKIIGLDTEVIIGIDEGLNHDSAIRCDEIVSIPKSKLTNFIGSLSEQKLNELESALKIALDIEDKK